MLVTCPHCNGGLENRPDIANTLVGCPYCGQQIQLPPYEFSEPTPNRRVKAKKKSSDNTVASLITLALAVSMLGGCVFLCSGTGSTGRPARQATSPAEYVGTGDRGVLRGSKAFLVCTTKEAHDKFIRSVNIKDAGIVQELLLSGQAFAVDEGTEVLVLKYGSTSEIRIIGGAMNNRRGFIASEFIEHQ